MPIDEKSVVMEEDNLFCIAKRYNNNDREEGGTIAPNDDK